MIFVSLGTMDMHFFQMAKAVDEWAVTIEENVVVQTGYTDYPNYNVEHLKFCTKLEMQKYMAEADVLVLQGGWGSVSEALEKRKRIMVMPRHDKTEHIHNQFQLIRKLYSLSCIVGRIDEKEFAEKIQKPYAFDFKQTAKSNCELLIINWLYTYFRGKTNNACLISCSHQERRRYAV